MFEQMRISSISCKLNPCLPPCKQWMNEARFIGMHGWSWLKGWPFHPLPPNTLFCLLQVHSNNRHTQGVRVFSKVECLFKPGILQPWSSPLTLPVPLEDLKDPSSRPISLPLGAQPAQILRCKFYFADRWLLISEISFLSGKQQHWNWYIFHV